MAVDKISTMYTVATCLSPAAWSRASNHLDHNFGFKVFQGWVRGMTSRWQEAASSVMRSHSPVTGSRLCGGAWSDSCCSLCLYESIRKPEHWRNKWSLQPANFSIRTHGKLHSARALYCAARRCKNWTLGNMMERRNLDIVPLLLGRTRIWDKNWLLWVLLLSIRLK